MISLYESFQESLSLRESVPPVHFIGCSMTSCPAMSYDSYLYQVEKNSSNWFVFLYEISPSLNLNCVLRLASCALRLASLYSSCSLVCLMLGLLSIAMVRASCSDRMCCADAPGGRAEERDTASRTIAAPLSNDLVSILFPF